MNKFIRILRFSLISIIIVWVIIWLSIRAYKDSERNLGKTGLFNSVIVELSKAPYLIKTYLHSKSHQGVDIGEDNISLKFGTSLKSIGIEDSTYILHSKFINKDTAKVYLQKLSDGEIELSWNISLDMVKVDLDEIRSRISKDYKDEIGPEKLDVLIPNSTDAIIIRHPIMLKDSSLLFKSQYLSYLYKIDKNSKLIWKSDRLTHHSIELDENNNIWVCSVDLKNELANSLKIRDDALLCLDQNGQELYFRSLTDIFRSNNRFKNSIEATPIELNKAGRDPYHLNEIEPVRKDGKYWKKGDIFISLRHKSIVALIRPKTDSILWMKQGPWFMQHDINIENDLEISIFNNNTSFINNEINTSSNLVKYNFETKGIKFYSEGIFSSASEGRQTSLSNGDFVVESTKEGKYFLIDSTFELKGSFVVPFEPNKSLAQYPGWSRFYLKTNNSFVEE